MSLKNIKLRAEVIEVSDGESFTVRGLSFTDLSTLYTKYAQELSAIFELFAKGQQGGEVDIEAAASVAASFITKAPALAAEAIALAAGEEDAFDMALQLPFPVQVEAIKRIGICTFGTEGTAKKFMTTVSAMILSKTSQQNPTN